MATLYKYYQVTGGEEEWTPIQANLSLDEIRPTFVTVLAVDTLIDKTTPREVTAKVKYQGPMYFDLDAADISDSIKGAKTLVKKLLDLELKPQDLLIYLSGKKGLHILVPEVCFMDKVQPTASLVAVYKELAFSLAVDTLDFRVYTAKRGRQLRTCYNARENGNYRVPISVEELENLTPETYDTLCKVPRVVNGHNPQWRGKFALLYDKALQKVGKSKPKTSKPVKPEVLKQQLPVFEKLASGAVDTDAGFNIIAMQLALYAREMRWSEEKLLELCSGVIKNHKSDGSRYNSANRREQELRRMYWYLEDNPSFEYNVAGLKACIKVQEPTLEGCVDGSEPEADSEVPDFGGVYSGATAYMAAKGEDGDIPITNFKLVKVSTLRDIEDGSILAVSGTLMLNGRSRGSLSLPPSSFTGGTAMQNSVASSGGSFSGTDIHARGVFQAMLKDSSKDVYILNTEGVNLFYTGKKASDDKKPYVAWADSDGVKSNIDMEAEGFNVAFQGSPDPRGLYKTDLIAATPMSELLANPKDYERALNCYKSLIRSHAPEVMGKMVGWAVASFYAPLLQAVYKKFPLLHIYGPAGGGKCLELGTQVIMADGELKRVEDVVVGEYLLSPSGAKQQVLSTCRGRERMWRVKQVYGDSYVVNESHILSLYRVGDGCVTLHSGVCIPSSQTILNINVKEYFDNTQLHTMFKGWKLNKPCDFYRAEEELPVHPYTLGLYLAGELDEYVEPHFTAIPVEYLLGSIETRKSVLAGIIDKAGEVSGSVTTFKTESATLAKDVVFMARSLGIAANLESVVKGSSKLYHEVSLTDDTLTDIEVEPLVEGDYAGFTLDGDHLFMLGDFTVTHNTETTRGLLRLFYNKSDALETTPASSLFALQQMMSASASIPLLMDEYKPHTIAKERVDQIRAILRDAYNAKDVQRGGGNTKVKDNFNALSTIKLQAPLVFVAEAPETETAIVERSVMVSFKRLAGRQQSECFRNAMLFYRDTLPMSSLGLQVANDIVAVNDVQKSLEKFEKVLNWANEKFLSAPDDWEKVAAGTMTQEEMRMRAIMRPRNVYNSTVSYFGLSVFKDILVNFFGAEVYEANFSDVMKEMARGCYLGMDALAAATLPEYVKVLTVFSDMSKLPDTDSFALIEDVDYNLSEFGGEAVLVIATPQAYRKYRAYMRYTGSNPLYPSEESFQLAMREIPQYIKMAAGTRKLSAPSTVLSLEGLYRAAVAQWKGKQVELSL